MHQENLEELFNNNLGLVNKIVYKMDFGLIDRDDLFQAGCLGLFNGLKKFDKDKGKLSTYVVPFIIGEIKKEIANQKLVKISKSLRKIKTELDLSKTIDENAKILKEKKENIILAMQYEESTCDVERACYFEEKVNLDCLELIEKRVIELKFIKNINQDEIASIYNISQSKVSRIIKEALKKLRTEG